MYNKYHNIFTQLQVFEDDIARLEGRVLELELRLEKQLLIERNHLLRYKNGEVISDEFILKGRPYMDLSPDQAWRLYSNPDFNFILLDVSSQDFTPTNRLPEAVSIPWEELPDRFMDLHSRTTPMLVISEDGTKSILACELLVKRGYYNCNNVSGGYKYWRGFRKDITG